MLLFLLACSSRAPAPGPPVVGVTGATPALLEALRAAGAEPVSLSPDGSVGDVELNGLVLGPGADLSPTRYQQPLHSTTVLLSDAREESDRSWAVHGLGSDLPILGVCLGAQELVVAFGGSLIQEST